MRWSTLIAAVVVGFLFQVTQPVQADQFSFSYLFSPIPGFPTPVSASGVLTTTSLDPVSDTYTILGITGTRLYQGVSQNITGLIAPGDYAGNDNLLFVTAPFLDGNGFSFTIDGTGNTGPDVNVFYDAFLGAYTENGDTIGAGIFTVTPVAVAGVPEPSSKNFFGAMILGSGGLFFGAWRRSRRSKA